MSLVGDPDLFARASLSIVFEATPFLLLGSLASGLVEAYVPREKVERLLPRGRLAATLVGLGLGQSRPAANAGWSIWPDDYWPRRYTLPGMAFSSIHTADLFAAEHLEEATAAPEETSMFEWRSEAPYAY
jgi:hypothetical protein